MGTFNPRVGIMVRDDNKPGAVVPLRPELVDSQNPGAVHHLREIDNIVVEISAYCAAVGSMVEIGDARTVALLTQEVIRRAARAETITNNLVDCITPATSVGAA